MSRFVINKGCDMCGKIETGLVELSVGKTKHHLCYDCMFRLGVDIMNYMRGNYTDDIIIEYDIKITDKSTVDKKVKENL